VLSANPLAQRLLLLLLASSLVIVLDQASRCASVLCCVCDLFSAAAGNVSFCLFDRQEDPVHVCSCVLAVCLLCCLSSAAAGNVSSCLFHHQQDPV
jgi:hypothetical protein